MTKFAPERSTLRTHFIIRVNVNEEIRRDVREKNVLKFESVRNDAD